MKKNTNAFSLIEIMVAIAIVGILAAVVLVSMQGYGARARATKALAQLSSMIPSMYSCWGNGGEVNLPPLSGGQLTSDVKICQIDGSDKPSYGSWVRTENDLENYYYFNIYVAGGAGNWVIGLRNAYDKAQICCNAIMRNCKLMPMNDDQSFPACDQTHPVN